MFFRMCWRLTQLALMAWVGAACLFVTVIVGLRGSDLFVDEVKSNHAKVLFPIYYRWEFTLLGTAAAAGTMALLKPVERSPRRGFVAAGAFALLLAGLAEYRFVYVPLDEMIRSPVMPGHFRQLHSWSMWINSVEILCCFFLSCVAIQGGEPARKE